ncbi:hypothetical protein [Criblamydia sequanensis]|uniref:Uncharacterized protein n=1 Tax=Candidatus Criblamydia sequanensis CRIB-18 TaxID=1437425 RepID=A0A090CYG5_9BACT|nr:hypothetical protein [Criblamydia sequanensis]CDR33582.1 hypothetical protein CSEC_0751 [Criblamydia sequanensis CRIB-18]
MTSENWKGIDLCQSYPNLSNSDLSPVTTLPKIPPSAILNRYLGETPIYGIAATNHRRARGWDWPNECRLELASEPGIGCSRIPVIAAFARLQDFQKNWELGKAVFEGFKWSPQNVLITLDSSKIIKGTLLSYSNNIKNNVLVIPNTFREIVQDKLSKDEKNTLLIPRSMALALLWIEKFKQTLIEKHEEGYIGHIRVSSLGLDEWTFHTIPLKIISENNAKYVVPIFCPQDCALGLGLWGIAYASHIFHRESEKPQPRKFWADALNGEFIDSISDGKEEILFSSTNTIQYSNHIKSMKELPIFENIPAEILPDEDLFLAVSKLWLEQTKKLPRNCQNFLGLVNDGCFCLSPWNGKNLGEDLSILGINQNVTCIVTKIPHDVSLASKGAAIFGTRVSCKVPSYQYKLIPMDIYCFTQGKEDWVPLIKENTTLEAGRQAHLEEIDRFSIKKGKSELPLYLRRPSFHSNNSIYKKIPVSIKNHEFKEDTKVILKIIIKPGEGFAKVEIKTRSGEVLAVIDWEKMEESDPPTQIGYIKKLRRIKPQSSCWKEVFDMTQKIASDIDNNKMPSKGHIKFLRDALKKKIMINDDAGNPTNEFYGPISSDTIQACDQNGLTQLRAALLNLFYNRKLKDSILRNYLIEAISCLYHFVPHDYLDFLRKLTYENKEKLNRVQLNCLARAFCSEEDIRLFYNAFLEKIVHNPEKPYYWILTLNQLLVFKENALKPETVSTDIIYTLLKFLKIQIRGSTGYANASVLCIAFLLYRRKFDSAFLEEKNEEFKEIEQALQSVIQRNDLKQIIKDRALNCLKLLKHEASEEDVTSLIETDSETEELEEG